MLDYISNSSDPADMACMERFYDMTLEAFQGTNNERLWLKTNIKLAKLWLDRKEYGRLTKSIRLLHQTCQKPDGTDDLSKGTYLLEVYAIEIQMFSETGNNKKLKVSPSMIFPWYIICLHKQGSLPEIAPCSVCCAPSKDYGGDSRVRREDVYE